MTFRGSSRTIAGVVALVLCSSLIFRQPQASRLDYVGIGPKFSMIVADHLGLGGGVGGHVLLGLDLGAAGRLGIYPNIEFWFASEDAYRYWNGRYWEDLNVFEISFNSDVRYYFPVPSQIRLRPFVGLGLGLPIVTVYDFDEDIPDLDHDETDLGAGFNMMGGFDIELSESFALFVELKGKFGDNFEVFKMTFGMTFGIM